MRSSAEAYFMKFSEEFEGRVPWMYVDREGLVTIGIGNLIEPMSVARELPFVNKMTGITATAQEIDAEWDNIHTHAQELKYSGYKACESRTSLRLPEAAIAPLVAKRLRENEVVLRRYFSNFDQYPADAQLALHSMAWAMGPSFVLPVQPAAGKEPMWKWPNFRNAMLRCDFDRAAAECRMRDINDGSVRRRNDANQALFRNAAAVLRSGSDPARLYYPGSVPPSSSITPWLLGWWKVTWRDQVYYYRFEGDARVGWTQEPPTSPTQALVKPRGLGSYLVASDSIVATIWSTTGTREKFQRITSDRGARMSGLLNETDPVLAERIS